MDITLLQERVKRAQRLISDPDFLNILDELDASFGFNQNVFGVLNAQKDHEFVLAKEGARAYSMKLRAILEDAKQALEYAKQENNDE